MVKILKLLVEISYIKTYDQESYDVKVKGDIIEIRK